MATPIITPAPGRPSRYIVQLGGVFLDAQGQPSKVAVPLPKGVASWAAARNLAGKGK